MEMADEDESLPRQLENPDNVGGGGAVDRDPSQRIGSGRGRSRHPRGKRISGVGRAAANTAALEEKITQEVPREDEAKSPRWTSLFWGLVNKLSGV